jgi:hypothetical protein
MTRVSCFVDGQARPLRSRAGFEFWRSLRRGSNSGLMEETQAPQVLAAKDYDAVADVEWEAKSYRIAIECERSLKSSDPYRDLVSAIADERQVRMILYLTCPVDLLC